MIELIIWILIYGTIEGVTEWLPVSSTGHLIIFESFWKPDSSLFTDSFLDFLRVVIQLGAVIAVFLLYRKRLNPFSSRLTENGKKKVWKNWIRIVVGCIPAGIAGVFFGDFFDENLYTWQVVALALAVYGILFIVVENKNRRRKKKYSSMEDIPIKVAFIIGLIQVLSLIPGTSRSGVTILAGLILGASRVAAADFTFSMAIPIMAGASLVKILKFFRAGNTFTGKQIIVLAAALFVSFVVSMFAVKLIKKYISRRNFKPFGYYRIALAVIITAVAFIFPGVLPGSAKAPSKYGLPDYIEEDYLSENEYSRPGTPLLQVKDIVIHYTANPGTSAKQNRNYFEGLSKQSSEDPTYASSNFIIGTEGEILAVVPIDEIAYCSNNRNNDTISIENCHPDETGKFTDETYASLVKLTAWLCDRYGLGPDNVIRHYDVTGKLCPLYFVEHEDAWETFKDDVQTQMDSLNETED